MADSRRVVSLADRRICPRCRLRPCVCSYIRELRPGGELEHLYLTARRLAAEPLPHRNACPCPYCYSRRLSTWETPKENLP